MILQRNDRRICFVGRMVCKKLNDFSFHSEQWHKHIRPYYPISISYSTMSYSRKNISSKSFGSRAQVQQQTPNPSLFISLPTLSERGKCWTEKNIREVIDSHDFGEIVQVILYKNKKNAIVHFERWFHGAEHHAVNISRGGSIRIPAPYGNHFLLVLYRDTAQFGTIPDRGIERRMRSAGEKEVCRNNVERPRSYSTHSNNTAETCSSSSSLSGTDATQLADIYAFIDENHANLEDGELFE